MKLAHYGPQASCLVIINEGLQPKDLATFLLRESVNLTADRLSILPLHPVRRDDRGPLSKRPPGISLNRAGLFAIWQTAGRVAQPRLFRSRIWHRG